MAHPIWKDYHITASGETIDFVVLYNDDIIYEGRAYARPLETSVDIKINDICANYISNEFPISFPNTGAEGAQYIFPFTIQTTNEGDETEEHVVEFLYDYSFDYTRNYADAVVLSAPILRKIPRNAPLLYSATSGTTYIELVERGGFSTAFNSAFDVGGVSTLNAQSIANNIFHLGELAKAEDAYVKVYGGDGKPSIDYAIIDGNYRYMLYYRNAFGGWDFLLVEGVDKQTDNYTRHTFSQSYTNTASRNRASVNYRNDIKREWLLNTLWIDDKGAQNMHHLLGSTEVFLYDLMEEVLHPITIDNSACEYKTYRNQGNQLVRYDIEVTSANTLMRR